MQPLQLCFTGLLLGVLSNVAAMQAVPNLKAILDRDPPLLLEPSASSTSLPLPPATLTEWTTVTSTQRTCTANTNWFFTTLSTTVTQLITSTQTFTVTELIPTSTTVTVLITDSGQAATSTSTKTVQLFTINIITSSIPQTISTFTSLSTRFVRTNLSSTFTLSRTRTLRFDESVTGTTGSTVFVLGTSTVVINSSTSVSYVGLTTTVITVASFFTITQPSFTATFLSLNTLSFTPIERFSESLSSTASLTVETLTEFSSTLGTTPLGITQTDLATGTLVIESPGATLLLATLPP